MAKDEFDCFLCASDQALGSLLVVAFGVVSGGLWCRLVSFGVVNGGLSCPPIDRMTSGRTPILVSFGVVLSPIYIYLRVGEKLFI